MQIYKTYHTTVQPTMHNRNNATKPWEKRKGLIESMEPVHLYLSKFHKEILSTYLKTRSGQKITVSRYD